MAEQSEKNMVILRTYAEDKLSNAIHNSNVHVILLDGPEGCGKTYFFKQYWLKYNAALVKEGWHTVSTDANTFLCKDDLLSVISSMLREISSRDPHIEQSSRQRILLFIDNIIFSTYQPELLLYLFDIANNGLIKMILLTDLAFLNTQLDKNQATLLQRFINSYGEAVERISVITDLNSDDGIIHNQVFDQLLNQTEPDLIFLNKFKKLLNREQLPDVWWPQLVDEFIKPSINIYKYKLIHIMLTSAASCNFNILKQALRTCFTLSPFFLSMNSEPLLPNFLIFFACYNKERICNNLISPFNDTSLGRINITKIKNAQDHFLSYLKPVLDRLSDLFKIVFSVDRDLSDKEITNYFKFTCLIIGYLDTGYFDIQQGRLLLINK